MNAAETPNAKRKIGPWSEHKKITLTDRNFKKLLKKGSCNIVVNYQWFRIEKQQPLELYTKDGRAVDLKQLKKLLRSA
jgi:hypothetical protein